MLLYYFYVARKWYNMISALSRRTAIALKGDCRWAGTHLGAMPRAITPSTGESPAMYTPSDI